ncbi:MAG: class I SAM-dependent methyltransferase [Candidatus Levybacteria bacterium]|nr:class I SAM-dependent methyltransferase [Candidatus Levybacteria bacterium]
MRLIHLKRAIAWIGILTYTLLKFWIKNPGETLAIFNFILEKIVASPKFFSRNIRIEKHSKELKDELIQTVKLYAKYGSDFNPGNLNSYKKIENILSDKAQILYFLTRKLKPKIVVETGVAAGKTSGYILQAIMDNKTGQLHSIDLPFQWYIYGNHKLHLDSLPPGFMPGYLIPEKLKKNWRLYLGNTYGKLPELLRSLTKIDIFLHDSEHSDKTMMFEYNQSWPYIKNRGYLLSDDISFTKAFKRFAGQKDMQYISFFDIGIMKKTR